MGELLLRFRIGREGEPRAASWIHVFLDGRLERREAGEDLAPGSRLYTFASHDEQVREVAKLANQVMSAEGLRPPSAWIPSETYVLELELELGGAGAARTAQFRWGRTELSAFVEEHGLGRKQEWYFKRLTELLFDLEYKCLQRSEVDDRPRLVEPEPLPAPEPEPEPQPADSVEEIVRRLVASPPRRLSDLEEIIGPVDFCADPDDGLGMIRRPSPASEGGTTFSKWVRSISVEYLFDIHHERAYALDDGRSERNPCPWAFSLSFARQSWFSRRRPAVRDVLESMAGPAVNIEESPFGPGWRYGDYYVFEQLGDSLHWYAQMPDWARPKPSGDLRARWLAELAEMLRAGAGHEALSAFVESLPDGLGFRRVDPHAPERFHFHCEPGMEAVAFSEALGLGQAIAHSTDTHFQNWNLFVTGRPGGWPFVIPRLGPWLFEACVKLWPQPLGDDAVLEDRVGSAPVYDLRKCEPNKVHRFVVSPDDGTWDR